MSYCGIFYVPQERSEAEAKYTVIYRHRNEYPVSVKCCFFQASRSGYYDFAHRLGKPEKNAALAEIIAEQREQLSYLWIPQDVAGAEKPGIYRNPKTILHIMERYGLLVEIRHRRKWQ